MPDEVMAPQTKPFEMSFSDWKKLKNALNRSVDSMVSQMDDLKGEKLNSLTKPNNNFNYNNNDNNFNYNNNNNNSNSNYDNCNSDHQNLLYFEWLKRNNQRIFCGDADGTFNNLSPSSSMFHSNMGRSCNPPQNNIDSNFFGSSPNNNFVMSQNGIPQLPFPETHSHSNGNMNTFKKNTFQSPTNKKIVPQMKETNEANQEGKNARTSKSKKQACFHKKPLPPPMNERPPESKEEKQRMWREYRQKMKPFKNREFHNAKRVIQRLGKKNFDELDEKEQERLTRAKETVNSHKNKLAEKAANRWTITNDTDSSKQSNGIVYVSKPRPVKSGCPVTPNMDPSPSPIESDFNDSMNSAGMVSKQYDLWNNLIPGGILLNSIEK